MEPVLRKREGRATSNGLVTAKAEGDLGVMLELNCETDFVAKGEKFQALADELLNHLAASSESPIWADNSPFIRDWPAINTPEKADNSSSRRFLSRGLIDPNSLNFFYFN